MPQCCVPYCYTSIIKERGVLFHQIPSDNNRRILWLKAIAKGGRPDDAPLILKQYDSVCQKHFKQDDYYHGPQRMVLRKCAVPSIFDRYSSNPEPLSKREKRSLVHIEDSQFEQHPADGLKKLKPNAVPTLLSDHDPALKPVKDSPQPDSILESLEDYVQKMDKGKQKCKRKLLPKSDPNQKWYKNVETGSLYAFVTDTPMYSKLVTPSKVKKHCSDIPQKLYQKYFSSEASYTSLDINKLQKPSSYIQDSSIIDMNSHYQPHINSGQGTFVNNEGIHNLPVAGTTTKSCDIALAVFSDKSNTTTTSTPSSHSISKSKITNSPIVTSTFSKPMAFSQNKADKNSQLVSNSNVNEISNLTPMHDTKIYGYRIVEFDYFFRMLKIANQHNESGFCNLNDVIIAKEWKNGLISSYYLKCTECNYQIHLHSERPLQKNVNADTVVGMLNAHINCDVMSQLLSSMNLPSISIPVFNREWEKITLHELEWKLVSNNQNLNFKTTNTNSNSVEFYKTTNENCELLSNSEETDIANLKAMPNQAGRGRRIIEFDYFFQMLKVVNQHSKNDCSLNHIDIINERRIGLQSIFFLKCTVCDYTIHLNSESCTKNRNINADTIEGMYSINANFMTLNKLLFEMGLIPIPRTFYTKECDELNNSSYNEAYRNVNYVTIKLQNSQVKEESSKHQVVKQEVMDDLNVIVVEDQFEIKEEKSDNEYEDNYDIFPEHMEIKTPDDKLIVSQGDALSNEIKIKQEIISDASDEELTGFEASEKEIPDTNNFEYYDQSKVNLLNIVVKQEIQDEIVNSLIVNHPS